MVTASQMHFHNMEVILRKTVSAHRAVMEGIATHAEKERARRQAAYHDLEARRKLERKVVKHDAGL